MAHIWDGNSEISANLRSNLGYLICYRHLPRSRAVTNLIFFLQKRPVFLHMCATCFKLPSNMDNISLIYLLDNVFLTVVSQIRIPISIRAGFGSGSGKYDLANILYLNPISTDFSSTGGWGWWLRGGSGMYDDFFLSKAKNSKQSCTELPKSALGGGGG